MMDAGPLTPLQLQSLTRTFHECAGEASHAMAQWLSAPAFIAIDAVDQQSISTITDSLFPSDEILCFAVMPVRGTLSGYLILSFDDASGLALTDLLLNRSQGHSNDWGELEQSAALESLNIIGCAYLNALARHLSNDVTLETRLLPDPPVFRREFAECLLQSVLLEQLMQSDTVFAARARFELQHKPLKWTLLFAPDGGSMEHLKQHLGECCGEGRE